MARGNGWHKTKRNRHPMRVYRTGATRVLSSACFFLFILLNAASAQAVADLDRKLNESDICAPLKFDIKEVAEFLGHKIPAIIPGNTTVGWDKNSHKVKHFSTDAHTVTMDIELGCQPSGEGALLKLFGKAPNDFRVTDAVSCGGARGPSGAVQDLSCSVSGEGAKFLGAITDLTGKLKVILNAVITNK